MKFDLSAITPLRVTVLQGSQPFYVFKNIVVWDKYWGISSNLREEKINPKTQKTKEWHNF